MEQASMLIKCAWMLTCRSCWWETWYSMAFYIIKVYLFWSVEFSIFLPSFLLLRLLINFGGNGMESALGLFGVIQCFYLWMSFILSFAFCL